jgi:hypothetical protein
MPRRMNEAEKKEVMESRKVYSPVTVFQLVDGILWSLDVHGCDHDDQVRDARDLGILCGNPTLTADAFIEKIEERWFEGIE